MPPGIYHTWGRDLAVLFDKGLLKEDNIGHWNFKAKMPPIGDGLCIQPRRTGGNPGVTLSYANEGGSWAAQCGAMMHRVVDDEGKQVLDQYGAPKHDVLFTPRLRVGKALAGEECTAEVRVKGSLLRAGDWSTVVVNNLHRGRVMLGTVLKMNAVPVHRGMYNRKCVLDIGTVYDVDGTRRLTLGGKVQWDVTRSQCNSWEVGVLSRTDEWLAAKVMVSGTMKRAVTATLGGFESAPRLTALCRYNTSVCGIPCSTGVRYSFSLSQGHGLVPPSPQGVTFVTEVKVKEELTLKARVSQKAETAVSAIVNSSNNLKTMFSLLATSKGFGLGVEVRIGPEW